MNSYKKLIDFIKAFKKEDKDSFDFGTINMAVAIQKLIEEATIYYLKSYSEIVSDYSMEGDENGSTRIN